MAAANTKELAVTSGRSDEAEGARDAPVVAGGACFLAFVNVFFCTVAIFSSFFFEWPALPKWFRTFPSRPLVACACVRRAALALAGG